MVYSSPEVVYRSPKAKDPMLKRLSNQETPINQEVEPLSDDEKTKLRAFFKNGGGESIESIVARVDPRKRNIVKEYLETL